VKPVIPDAAARQRVRIPLVKTATGELDYTVVLTYGGKTGCPPHLGMAKIPLIRTVNISADLSQLELFLPHTHTWFHFGGTMEHVRSHEDFQVGFLQYQAKVGKSLLQVLRYGDLFSQKRAAANLGRWEKNLRDYQSGGGVVAQSESLSRELSNVEGLLSESDQELQKMSETGKRVADRQDNRLRLNDAYQGQVVNPTANAVLKAGSNWDDAGVRRGEPSTSTATFNTAWFEDKKLAPVPQARPTDGKKKMPDTGKDKSEVRDESRGPTAGLKAPSAPSAERESTPASPALDSLALAKSPIITRGVFGTRESAARASEGEIQQTRSQTAKAEQYAQKLAKQQAVPSAIGGLTADRTAHMVVPQTSAQEQPLAGPTGLASLDVQLPDYDSSRWQRFLFRTPRGETTVIAWAISRATLNSFKRIAVAVILAAIGLLMRIVFRGWRPNHETRKHIAVGLIITGMVCLLVGILPVGAGVVVVYGVVLRLRRAPEHV
ncbi:MAG: hypothetical protein N2255_01690, partial [Kiritimatiellae bacterium]|nr:hypothetical protein [Kiritimatiellia bacterium]